MKYIKIKIPKKTQILNIIWLLGIIHIIYFGLQPYPHYITGELQTAKNEGIALICAYFSIYFFISNIMFFSNHDKKYFYLTYVFQSVIVIFQFFIATIASMHAPPFIVAYIVNCIFLVLLHFIFYPIYLIYQKKSSF
ncbi:hypothetical protein A6M14_00450 [Acinetobacter sp. Ac_877]|nr:hypothetical protein [Acinetobacter portensis]